MESTPYLLKNGLVVTGDRAPFRGHVFFDGTIREVSATVPDVSSATRIIDCTGYIVRPAGIDIHTHFSLKISDTLQTIEDFASGTTGALAGGITTIGDFATQLPGQTLIECYENRLEEITRHSKCSFRLHLAVTDWQEDSFQQIGYLQEKYGLQTIKLFTTYKERGYNSSNGEILDALVRSRDMNFLVMIHCEDNDIIEHNQQKMKRAAHLPEIEKFRLSRPGTAETTAVNTVCYLNQWAKGNLYIVHASHPESVRLLLQYRAQNPQARYYLESCPQYFLFDDRIFNTEDGYLFSSQPQLKSPENAHDLYNLVLDNAADVLATDNCAFSRHDKDKGIKEGFLKLPVGLPGTQFLLPATYSSLVRERGMKLDDWVRLTAVHQAEIFGLSHTGLLQKGKAADIILFDPEYSREISGNELCSGADWSPYLGREITGKIMAAFHRGVLSYTDTAFSKNRQ